MKEIRDCSIGEVNSETNDYFCIAYQKNCKEMEDCYTKIFIKRYGRGMGL